jgi:transposase
VTGSFGVMDQRSSEKPCGVRVLSKRRWAVESTFAWLDLSRGLSKDYEPLAEKTGERMVHEAVSHIITA